jgi:hypothetical protein
MRPASARIARTITGRITRSPPRTAICAPIQPPAAKPIARTPACGHEIWPCQRKIGIAKAVRTTLVVTLMLLARTRS